jgi:hypothetical protein
MYSDMNPSQCHSVQHTSHMKRSGIEPSPRGERQAAATESVTNECHSSISSNKGNAQNGFVHCVIHQKPVRGELWITE